MKVIFNKGMRGLEDYKEFEIVDLEGLEPYKMLQSTKEKELGLVVISPFEVDLEYQVKLSEEIIDSLQISSEEDVVVYATVNISDDISKITANLRAPIIININKALGEQIILSNESYKIKHPIFKG